jgi:formyltetrahydrofolate synthetase
MPYYNKRYDNPVMTALVKAPYAWMDPTMVQTSLVSRGNPEGYEMGVKEVVVAAGVGVVMSLVGERLTTPLILGTTMYVIGYVAKEKGWLEPLIKAVK